MYPIANDSFIIWHYSVLYVLARRQKEWSQFMHPLVNVVNIIFQKSFSLGARTGCPVPIVLMTPFLVTQKQQIFLMWNIRAEMQGLGNYDLFRVSRAPEANKSYVVCCVSQLTRWGCQNGCLHSYLQFWNLKVIDARVTGASACAILPIFDRVHP